jgi:hypothetical protein
VADFAGLSGVPSSKKVPRNANFPCYFPQITVLPTETRSHMTSSSVSRTILPIVSIYSFSLLPTGPNISRSLTRLAAATHEQLWGLNAVLVSRRQVARSMCPGGTPEAIPSGLTNSLCASRPRGFCPRSGPGSRTVFYCWRPAAAPAWRVADATSREWFTDRISSSCSDSLRLTPLCWHRYQPRVASPPIIHVLRDRGSTTGRI